MQGQTSEWAAAGYDRALPGSSPGLITTIRGTPTYPMLATSTHFPRLTASCDNKEGTREAEAVSVSFIKLDPRASQQSSERYSNNP